MTDPYETLGLPPGASLREVEVACQRLRELYAEESLATYSLLPDEERRERLQQIELASQAILAAATVRSTPADQAPADPGPQPEAAAATGAYLRWLRERAGIGLRELAERTKISAAKLEAIERESFEQLPPPVYLRGFVAEYARCLGAADPRALAENLLSRHPGSDEH